MADDPKRYFYGQQFLDDDDYNAVAGVLHRRYISQGPSLATFEQGIAEYTGAGHCLALSSGTAALQVACRAVGLRPGDRAWTSALSFVASANAIRHAGAEVDFVDIDPKTLNMDLNLLEDKLKAAGNNGTRPQLVMPVHFAGLSCDMRGLRQLADRYEFRIVEDAAQALGGGYENSKIGSCAFSDATVFSLHPVKTITTGEGGLITTNDAETFKSCHLQRGHGIVLHEGPYDDIKGPWHREMIAEGFNYRITEFQCALGVSQLKKIDKFIQHRSELASRYHARLAEAPVELQTIPGNVTPAWHLLVVLLDLENSRKGKLQIFRELEDRFVHLSLHYYPIPLHPFYRALGFKDGDYPNAETYYRRAFSFPIHVGLDIADVDYVCDNLIEVLQ